MAFPVRGRVGIRNFIFNEIFSGDLTFSSCHGQYMVLILTFSLTGERNILVSMIIELIAL